MTRPLWNALSTALLLASALACSETPQRGNEVARGRVYEVVELDFTGPEVGTADTPARDIDLDVLFRHESGAPEYRVFGFWDGDGRSGASGNVFKVRFLPTEPGRWVLVEVASNRAELDGQQEGNYVTAEASEHPGFWIVDDTSPGRRWYRRSDGSHPYIYGNTHYSFLSGTYLEGKPSGNDITADIRGNAAYFKKLRFGLHGDRYPHPTEKLTWMMPASRPTGVTSAIVRIRPGSVIVWTGRYKRPTPWI